MSERPTAGFKAALYHLDQSMVVLKGFRLDEEEYEALINHAQFIQEQYIMQKADT